MRRSQSAKNLQPAGERLVDERAAVGVQAIEEEGRDRNGVTQPVGVPPAAEALHRDLKWMRLSVGAQRDDFTVQHDLAHADPSHRLDYFRDRCGHVPQRARIRAHLLARFVHLDSRAVKLVFQQRLAQLSDGRRGVGRRLREHRLHRVEWPDD